MPQILEPPRLSRFGDASVAERYHLRPSYPPETFDILRGLITDRPVRVLDIGCGTGDIARTIAMHADRVDAVDSSLPMLEHGKALAEGDATNTNIQWIHESAESFAGQGPYALITAGQSLHWMDWETALPKMAAMLTSNGVLAITTVLFQPRPPWQDGYTAIVKKYSNDPAYRSMNISEELESAGLFRTIGLRRTAPMLFKQTVMDYIESQHGRSSLSLDAMTKSGAEGFKQEMWNLLQPYATDDVLSFHVVGEVVWGRPMSR
ncbi:hypothetical protein K4F52_003927 [Lecanicillium sp. MT-2017a]|nr:hypothetical protein K4F52_003927 [Lecanicillium sp. MT-2017a]